MISVIMPCYEAEASVERTIRSVQAQDEEWELICVDDGSTDHTLERLQDLAANDSHIRVIHQVNGGVSRARNTGIRAATGEWLFFLDADDVLTPNAFRILLDLETGGEDILLGAYVIREEGKETFHACAPGGRHEVYESLLRGDSALNSMCARLYRTRFVRENGLLAPEGIAVGEDVLFNLEAFRLAGTWNRTETVVYQYDLGGNSAMIKARRNVYARSMPMLQGIDAFLERNGLETELFRAHIDAYLRMLRADRGRVRAALAFPAQAVLKNVRFSELCPKQKLYYLALRVLPCTSLLLP